MVLQTPPSSRKNRGTSTTHHPHDPHHDRLAEKEYQRERITKTDDKKSFDDCQIGFGATADLFKVKVISVKNEVAIGKVLVLKRYREQNGLTENNEPSDEFAVQKLRKEAGILNNLAHENIVQFIGYCVEKPRFGLLLEFCHGGSFKRLLRSMNPNISVPLKTLINWAQQVVAGMVYLTSKGYIHRDLKADNVLVKQAICRCGNIMGRCECCGGVGLHSLTLKLADFGETRRMVTVSQMHLVGTHAYMSPELFKTHKYSESSDMWAFGVFLWEMLTRDSPLKNGEPIAFAFAVSRNGQSLEIDKTCPTPLRSMMLSCWELVPEKRPTFRSISECLKEYAVKDEKDPTWVLPARMEYPSSDGKAEDLLTKCLAEIPDESPQVNLRQQGSPEACNVCKERIGFGATAEIFKVKVVATGEVVALKRYRGQNGLTENKESSKKLAVQESKKEAGILNNLTHENIVQFLRYSVEGLYLELCQGGSLKRLLCSMDRNTPIQLNTLINWAQQISAAMEYLISKGYIHRDLTTDNVLVKQAVCRCGNTVGQCKRCGAFGLESLTLKLTLGSSLKRKEEVTENELAGRLEYLAPEAFKISRYSEASDVWAFGVVLWEIWTRDTVRKGIQSNSFAFTVARDRQKLENDKSCPLEWKKLIQSCWVMEPEDRPTFQQISDSLKRYAEKHEMGAKWVLPPPKEEE